MDFLIGGTAATLGGVVSNPFEVIKTRQQLQGELQRSLRDVHQPYGSLWQSIKSIVQAEGLIGLQKGGNNLNIEIVPISNFCFHLSES